MIIVLKEETKLYSEFLCNYLLKNCSKYIIYLPCKLFTKAWLSLHHASNLIQVMIYWKGRNSETLLMSVCVYNIMRIWWKVSATICTNIEKNYLSARKAQVVLVSLTSNVSLLSMHSWNTQATFIGFKKLWFYTISRFDPFTARPAVWWYIS